jgi:hypothetical protein
MSSVSLKFKNTWKINFSSPCRIPINKAGFNFLFTQASEQVFLEFELEPELDEKQLRKYFIMELQKFHPEVSMPEKFKKVLWSSM